MKSNQYCFSGSEWRRLSAPSLDADVDLVLVFGSSDFFSESGFSERISAFFPNSGILGCSTAGEIVGSRVLEQSLVITTLQFDKAKTVFASERIQGLSDSYACGERLAERLPKEDLCHVILFSRGIDINGTALVDGIQAGLPEDVLVTGGLAGDNGSFSATYVVCCEACGTDLVAAVGLYGDSLTVGYGSFGGWRPFGPYRLVTRADGNVVYEFDGRPALDLYREYLGEYASDLPSSGLLFPISVSDDPAAEGVVRTLLGIDEDAGAIVYAGDVKQGSYARLMTSGYDRLIDGAGTAAAVSTASIQPESADFALLISCVGRKLVLKNRTDEELEIVSETLGLKVPIAGFYSYGEISPANRFSRCELHNQTMTITVLAEQ